MTTPDVAGTTRAKAKPPRSTGPRIRDAAASRANLLAAAAGLFAELGYEATSVREIGRRADVDPTLIARYFGSKAALYLETLRQGSPDNPPPNLTDHHAVFELLERVQRNGVTPTLRAAIRPHDDQELQDAALEMLDRRITGPFEVLAQAGGSDDPRLRAEVLTAALAGIVISRISNALPVLSNASDAEVARLIAELIRDVVA